VCCDDERPVCQLGPKHAPIHIERLRWQRKREVLYLHAHTRTHTQTLRFTLKDSVDSENVKSGVCGLVCVCVCVCVYVCVCVCVCVCVYTHTLVCVHTYKNLRGHNLNLGHNYQAWVQAQRRGESVFFSIRTIRTNIRESLKITPEAPWGFREAPPVKLPEFPWSFPDASQKLPEAFWSFPEASRTSESFPEASWENFFWSFKKISQREIFLQTCCACKSATGRFFLKFQKKIRFFWVSKKKISHMGRCLLGAAAYW